MLILLTNSCNKDEKISSKAGQDDTFIKIGTQTWHAGNFDGVVTAMGTAIPNVYNNTDWAALKTPAWRYLQKSPSNGLKYGIIYNGFAIDLIKADILAYNLANPAHPYKYKIATENDWNKLITYLGGTGVAGGKMKPEGNGSWNFPNTGANNESGLSLPGSGYLAANGDDQHSLKNYSALWTEEKSFVQLAYNAASATIVSKGDKSGGVIRMIKSESVKIIALSGQSNAVGFYPDDILPSGWNREQDHILINFNRKTGSGFYKMNPLFNCGFNRNTETRTEDGWGAEQSAAHELLTVNNDVIIVKTGTVGGIISQWDACEEPYTSLEAGLIAALNSTELKYNVFSGLSLLWMQGETDAMQDHTTAFYEAKMRSVISRLRASDLRLSNLQIVMTTLPAIQTKITLLQKARINKAFADIAADTPNTLLLDTDAIKGLEMRWDNLHYTAASLLLIGSAWKSVIHKE